MEKLKEEFSSLLVSIENNLPTLITAVLVLVIGFFMANKIKAFIQKRTQPKSESVLAGGFVAQFVNTTIKFLTIVVALRIIGFTDLTSNLLAGAGIITAILGFAFKDIGENFLAGILLAFKSPFKINDLIETEGVIGNVVDLTIRETRIKTLDGKDVFIPNGQIIKNPLYNYTIDGFLRYDFVVGLDYNSNIKQAIQVIIDTVNNVENVLKGDKKPTVAVEEFAPSTINIRVFFWIDTFQSRSKSYHIGIESEVMKRVLESLTQEGFGLPADIVEIKQYKS